MNTSSRARACKVALLSMLSTLALAGCQLLDALAYRSHLTPEPGSYEHGQQTLNQQLQKKPNQQNARGIILFVGDGMSLATVTAGRIYAGQKLGKRGEEHQLGFESFAHVGLSKTYNTNQQTPDSAGTMTAMVTGQKTRAGMISVSPVIDRGSVTQCNEGKLTTILELAEQAGWATGIVTTTTLTHATPAANYAHTPERRWESDSAMPEQAIANGCKDIARQFVDFNLGNGIEVALGGGIQHFLPLPAGKRKDGQNLVNLWQQKYPDGLFVDDRDSLMAAPTSHSTRLLGLFSASHLAYEHDRGATTQPSLSQMTQKALAILQQHEQFLLIVESGRIDHAHHQANAFRALEELHQFDAAIAAAKKMTGDDTLLIVTADHSHTMSIAGYPTRGNAILDFVKENDHTGHPREDYSLALDGKPYTTLGYANGPGHCHDNSDDAALKNFACNDSAHVIRPDPQHADPLSPQFRQASGVPLYLETHAGDDVPIYASGPWAHLLDGVVEQNYLFHVMKYAAGL